MEILGIKTKHGKGCLSIYDACGRGSSTRHHSSYLRKRKACVSMCSITCVIHASVDEHWHTCVLGCNEAGMIHRSSQTFGHLLWKNTRIEEAQRAEWNLKAHTTKDSKKKPQ